MSHRLQLILTGASSVLLGLSLLSGCVGSRSAAKPPDERFGNRVEGEAPDGRATLVITPPDSSVTYFYYPAVFDTLHVRPALFSPDEPLAGQEVSVELLVKGALPDACAELHAVEQKRIGHILTVELQMRRPKGAVCVTVMRPYRFYVMLEGTYEPGPYTLKFNGAVRPFEVLPTLAEKR